MTLVAFVAITCAAIFALFSGFLYASLRKLRLEWAQSQVMWDEITEGHKLRADEQWQEIDRLRRRVENDRVVIEKALEVRDFWGHWYHRQVAEHGAAQSTFLAELELHVKRGCKVPFNPFMTQLFNEFADVHPHLADAAAKENGYPSIAPERQDHA
jgi:hypothetical protein